MKSNFLACLATLTLLTALAAVDVTPPGREKLKMPTPAVDLSGYYACDGKTSEGKGYRGIVSVHKLGDIYAVQWNIGLGQPAYVGVGMVRDDQLAVGWASLSEGGKLMRGLTWYRIDGKKFSGRWTSLPGDGTTANEEALTYLRPLTSPKEILHKD
jgi:hypothetical protein